MDIIDINELEFLDGTYDNHKIAKYGSFVIKNDVKICNKETITVYQVQDDIVLVYISGSSWTNNFTIEGMKYDSSLKSGHLSIVIGRHNKIVRDKAIDVVLG